MYILCSLPFSAAPKGNLYSPSEIDAPAFLIVQFAIPFLSFLHLFFWCASPILLLKDEWNNFYITTTKMEVRKFWYFANSNKKKLFNGINV